MRTELNKIANYTPPAGRGKVRYQRVYLPFEWMEAIGCPKGTEYRAKLDTVNNKVILEPVR